jgi:hypothetical protein
MTAPPRLLSMGRRVFPPAPAQLDHAIHGAPASVIKALLIKMSALELFLMIIHCLS